MTLIKFYSVLLTFLFCSQSLAHESQQVDRAVLEPVNLLITVRMGKPTTTNESNYHYGTYMNVDDRNIQQVVVLNGKQAFISAGQSFPIINSEKADNDIRTEYMNTSRGYYVTPTLVNDTVELNISQQQEIPSPQGGSKVDHQYLESITRVAVGEWVLLGGTVQRGSSRKGTKVYRSYREQSIQGEIYVKVDLAHILQH